MPDKWWGGSDPKLPPCLPGPSTPHGQGVLRAGGSGSEGASLARLARAPQFPGVTCESPPATSSALFLFTFPLPPTSRLTQRRDPSAEPCRAQPVPGILPHPRQAGGGGGTAPLPGRCPPFPPSLRPSPPHPDEGMLQPGHPSTLPAPSAGPTEPELGPPARTRSGAALAPLPATAPSHERLGPRGAFREVPAPAHTHVRTPGARRNDRQGLEKGWGVFTVPRAASAGPDAAPGRSAPLPPASSARASPQAAQRGAPAAGETEARGGSSPPGVPAVAGASATPRLLNPPRVPRVRTPKPTHRGSPRTGVPRGNGGRGSCTPALLHSRQFPTDGQPPAPLPAPSFPPRLTWGRRWGGGRGPAARPRCGGRDDVGALARPHRPPPLLPSLPPSADAASPPLPSLQLNRQTLGKSHPRGGGPGAAGPCRHTNPA